MHENAPCVLMLTDWVVPVIEPVAMRSEVSAGVNEPDTVALVLRKPLDVVESVLRLVPSNPASCNAVAGAEPPGVPSEVSCVTPGCEDVRRILVPSVTSTLPMTFVPAGSGVLMLTLRLFEASSRKVSIKLDGFLPIAAVPVGVAAVVPSRY